jgi:hypothetical protein
MVTICLSKMKPISRRCFLKLAGYTGMIGLVASYPRIFNCFPEIAVLELVPAESRTEA